MFYAKKSWTLKELHMQFFQYNKDLLLRWLKDIKDDKISQKSKLEPKYKNPDTGEPLIYDDFVRMDMEKQFATFFPTLTDENWKELFSKRNFDLEEMPYQLRVENSSGYA